MAEKTVTILVREGHETAGSKGLFDHDGAFVKSDISIATLRKNITEEIDKLISIFDSIEARDQWKPTELEVGLEISAEGGVSFIGTATVAANASVKIKFGR